MTLTPVIIIRLGTAFALCMPSALSQMPAGGTQVRYKGVPSLICRVVKGLHQDPAVCRMSRAPLSLQAGVMTHAMAVVFMRARDELHDVHHAKGISLS